MKEKTTYILKGKLKNIEMRIAHTKEGEKEYGMAEIEVKGPKGKDRIVPIMTFYPSGVDFLYMAKENSNVEVFGTFTKLKGTNGINRFFELIGRHKKKTKDKTSEMGGIELGS
jgi:hypothetical protein